MVIRTGHDSSTAPHTSQERQEALTNPAQITVHIEVVGFEIRNNRDVGGQRVEGTIVFVRLDNEEFIRAKAEVAVPTFDASTDESGRVQATRCDHLGGHGRGRGFAMSSGDGDDVAIVHNRTQCLRSLEHGNATLVRAQEFRMVHRNSCRHDQSDRFAEVLGIVADRQHDTVPLEVANRLTVLGVAAGHLSTMPNNQLRQRTHARATDTHEMNWALARERTQIQLDAGHEALPSERMNVPTCAAI